MEHTLHPDETRPAPAPETSRLAASDQSVNVTVIGVGGAGVNAVTHMAGRGIAGITFAVAHTDQRALARCPVGRKVQIGAKLTRGLSTGGNPELGRAAAEEDAHALRELCQDADMVFVVTGLGGGTATGASLIVAQIAKESGALVLALVTLPFDFEGLRRQQQALAGLETLKAAADGVICLSNQKVFRMLDENTPVVEAFRITNDLLTEGVCGIGRLLTSPGVLNIDFADLCRVVRGHHAESAFATAEARGPNRSREVLEKLLANPLLDEGHLLNEADDILVSLIGGPDLSMADIHRVMDQIRRQSENAHLIMGAAVDASFAERLAVTLVASRRAPTPECIADPPPGQIRLPAQQKAAATGAPELETQLLHPDHTPRPPSRFVAPPPEFTPERAEQLIAQQSGKNPAKTRKPAKLRQSHLPLEIISKGRFEKSQPTIYRGQDLDVPTYTRRGVALN
jgi:cell division protein FtsZ